MMRRDLIGIFANHRVAANLLMALMIVVGLLALKKLHVYYFPNFELDIISVSTSWPGASAEDIETAITQPLEQRLKSLDHLNEINSTSSQGASGITLEFEDHTDISQALNNVKKVVDGFTNLPEEALIPVVTQAVRYESVARVLIQGKMSLSELRKLVRKYENDLLTRGIDKVDVVGLPQQNISIALHSEDLVRLGLNWEQLAAAINKASQNVPAGVIGKNDVTRELRSLNRLETVKQFQQLIISNKNGQLIRLGDVADITLKISDNEQQIKAHGQTAVVLSLRRNESGDSLKSAKILQKWVSDIQGQLPPTVTVKVFSQRWQHIKERILLLLKNGAGGLVLVLLILYLFLSSRVAFWVAVGIPVSFMATLGVLYAAGGSINMVSLFALIMALGIIVDDAIVVGEDAQSHFDQGEDPLLASEGGARRMLAPVMASSLTTIAAFLPLMLVGGRMGNIMWSIPLVIISVIIASLIESFFILPGHLKNAFKEEQRDKKSKLRKSLEHKFNYFRDHQFKSLVTLSLEYRLTTIMLAIGMLVFSMSLFLGGRIGWQFFPSPESTTVYANVRFVAGTSEQKVEHYLVDVEQALQQTMSHFKEPIVETYYVLLGSTSGGHGRGIRGARNGSIYVELLPSDQRKTTNKDFIKQWRKQVKTIAGIENFSIASRRVGPGSRDLEIKLEGNDANQLKQAALSLQETLKDIPGVSAIDDDLPYGREQLIYDVTDAGKVLGLNTKDVGKQIRDAYSGSVVQRFQQGIEEVEVRLHLADEEQHSLTSLQQLPISLPSGDIVPLEVVAKWRSKQGFEALRHSNGLLSVAVTANVNSDVNNILEITQSLEKDTLPELTQRYNLSYELGGRNASQTETLSDMKIGVWIALLLMYFVLSWVFSSYGWPFIVMLAIPLGLTGAVLGHWAMGMNMTILSLFGFFALSGIVVNDSIILVSFYNHIKNTMKSVNEALVEAACQRLRAVLLTSLTTIAGLTPLLFETSRQAQFLIPMVTSIAFGLGFATLLILFVIPALLSFYEDARAKLLKQREN